MQSANSLKCAAEQCSFTAKQYHNQMKPQNVGPIEYKDYANDLQRGEDDMFTKRALPIHPSRNKD